MTTARRLSNQTALTLTVVGTAYLIFIFLGLPDGLLGVAWPSIRSAFGLAQGQMGVLLLASTSGFLITSFGTGRLISTFGIVAMLVAACVVRGAALAAMGISPTFWAMIAAAFCFGIASGAIDAGLNTYFAMNLSPRLMNWLHASFGLGATIGPILMTTLFSLGLAWRWGYVIVGVLQAALALVVIARAGDWQARAATGTYSQDGQSPVRENYRSTLRRPIVWVSILLFLFYAGMEVTAGNWSYSLFTEERGVSIAVAGFWVSVYWLSFTAGRIVFGFFADRLNVSHAIRSMLLIGAGATLLLWWNPVNWVGFVGLAIFGFAMAPIFPLLVSETPARLGAADATNAIGFQVGAASLGIALLPGLAGVLAENVSLAIIPPFMLICVIIIILLHEVAVRGHPSA